MKAGIHIFSFLAALFITCCCGEVRQETASPQVKLISVSGVVTDAADGAPVGGITVTMTAYELDDTQKAEPLFSESYDTASDGSYWFMRSDESTESLTGVYYEFILIDTFNQREEHYKPVHRSLFLSPTSPFYNPVTKVYKSEKNNFTVSK